MLCFIRRGHLNVQHNKLLQLSISGHLLTMLSWLRLDVPQQDLRIINEVLYIFTNSSSYSLIFKFKYINFIVIYEYYSIKKKY